jgi:DNA polymerase I-like protein with 3'-5' exonuclease and polymerase domains
MNDKEYIDVVLEGDIHSHNAEAFGVDRDTSKTLLYAMMYGGGDWLIGKLTGGGKAKGRQLKSSFEAGVPAFARLKNNLLTAALRGYLIGLDGRHLYLRSEHKALSQLLQSAGAILCKTWVLYIDRELRKQYPQGEAYIVGWIHDEVQIACKTKEIAEHVGSSITAGMARKSGEAFKFNIPISSEYQVGASWAQTH